MSRAGDEGGCPIGSLVARRAVYSRNAVAWISARAWRTDMKPRDVRALKAAEQNVDPVVIARAAIEVADLAKMLFAPLPGFMVSTVAVGHSRRPDSFSVRLAAAVAKRLELPFEKLFADRYVSGVSHPKELKKLPPLQRLVTPTANVLLVDDVATSGWHIEDAAHNLRGCGVAYFAVSWISGTVMGEGASKPQLVDFGLPKLPKSVRRTARLALGWL
jgi:hypothetical protein